MATDRALLLDLETYSEVDLPTQGAARYAEDQSTRILCASFALLEPGEASPSQTALWWPGEELPEWALDALHALPWVAHNAAFERLVLRHHRPEEWPVLAYGDPANWHCTQAMCGLRGLPLALDEAAIALGQSEEKDPAGKRLIKRCCTPQMKKPPTADEIARLGEYCLQDVRAEAELAHAIGWRLPGDERTVWLVDQKANDRGIPLDLDLARGIDRIADWLEATSSKRLAELTDGAVTSLTQNKALAEWAGLESVSKSVLASPIALELSPEVQEALTHRPRTSLRKARRAMKAVCADGRIRHAQQYHAATTGRWGGRIIQPHNLPRPVMTLTEADYELLATAPPDVIASIMGKEWMEDAAVSAMRGMIAAHDDGVLTRADLSAIEARVVLWLAGEWDAVDKYRRGVDLYCDFAAQLYGYEIVKGMVERQHGKIGILGCGFQAGARRLYQQALDDGVPNVTFELMEKLVATYRSTYARVPAMWHAINDAAIAAVRNPSLEWTEVKPRDGQLAASIAFRVVQGPAGHRWLLCRLPSGRRLHYFDPHLSVNRFGRDCVQWWAMKPGANGGRKWSVVSGYGGFFTENIVQAIARDIIAKRFVELDRDGHRPLFLVHDEVICDGGLTAAALEGILSELVDFASGLPIAAEGESEMRFGK